MDFELLFRNRRISVPFELEQVELGILIPGIPIPERLKRNAAQFDCFDRSVCSQCVLHAFCAIKCGQSFEKKILDLFLQTVFMSRVCKLIL